ncbi:hypothetical protein Zmor_009343 [Zophobas morio]|uniref:Uncharacterized protein n=1 Tax=Zophobas morio TaxID=2755281 RepID=A0AA38IL05_9CUCU|nr:hypothetical protein Zmor_009343 [Zophobas morio]
MSHQTRAHHRLAFYGHRVNYYRRFLVITNLSRLSRWRTQLYRCVYQGGISGPGKVEMGRPIGPEECHFFFFNNTRIVFKEEHLYLDGRRCTGRGREVADENIFVPCDNTNYTQHKIMRPIFKICYEVVGVNGYF